MLPPLILLCALSFADAAVESICLQVAPVNLGEKWVRSPNQNRAVVLIHGFYLRGDERSVPRAELRPWQQADAALPKELGKHADVFVFAYGQNVVLESVLKHSKLASNISAIRKAGYTEITLIGHSAGGIIARQFVEDNPDAGVNKVFQVCSPNIGSPFAIIPTPKSQRVFLDCLTEENCRKRLAARADKVIPRHVEFVCVIGRIAGTADNDGIVMCTSQWSQDLQKQGIPAISVAGDHAEVMRDAKIAVTFANLLRDKHGRWTVERIEQAKKAVFGN